MSEEQPVPTWPVGAPAWTDLSVSDIERSKAFYARVLGWDYEGSEPEFGGYVNATVDGRVVAGLAPPMEGQQEVPHTWAVYLAVEDSTATQDRIAAAGGSTVLPAMQLGPWGTMGVYADPTGAVFGTWEPAAHTGFQVSDGPGSVNWTEAMVGDFERGKEFYTSVFGWTYQDMSSEEMKYAIFTTTGGQEAQAGGIGEVEAGEQPYWSVVFEVENTDAAAQRVTEAGGAVTVEPFDFEFGRLAICTGPDGEQFAVIT
ncbi:VOC family protein [Ornithinimicrobium pratense]|uniref:VOC family protein n=1 Tax=Ornithinimicrobium pratense TaxID=2593973 RepID=A0A5J6V385_9MICO|nr:VOC family protein [Ornithinimicrobium pratense]QFG67621.1 VOC family protein [Ornithinimicrobium pratense]